MKSLHYLKGSEIVYIIRNTIGHYKIGITDDLAQRLIHLQTGNSLDLTLVLVLNVSNARQVEQELHDYFRAKHIRGEWFELVEDDLEYIKNYNELEATNNNFFRSLVKRGKCSLRISNSSESPFKKFIKKRKK